MVDLGFRAMALRITSNPSRAVGPIFRARPANGAGRPDIRAHQDNIPILVALDQRGATFDAVLPQVDSASVATIAASQRIGHNVAHFKEFLSVFEYNQRLHVADRDRLRKDLENASRPRGEKRLAESRE
jgi:hypothetical protein